MRRLYTRPRETMIDALTRHFGAGIEIVGDPAGMHMVVRFRAGVPIARGPGHRVQLTSMRAYYAGDPRPQEFIFCFSGIGERTIREGIKRIAGLQDGSGIHK